MEMHSKRELKEPKTSRSPWYIGLITLLCAVGFVIVALMVPQEKDSNLYLINLILGKNLSEPIKQFKEIFENLGIREYILLGVLCFPVVSSLLATIFSKFRLINGINVAAFAGLVVFTCVCFIFDIKDMQLYTYLQFIPVVGALFAFIELELCRK